MTNYLSRSSAIRAARTAARRALGPGFIAYEGPDFIIYPVEIAEDWRDRWRFELRGPAADPDDELKAIAEREWARVRQSAT